MAISKIAPPVEIRSFHHASSAGIGRLNTDNVFFRNRNSLLENPSRYYTSWEQKPGFRNDRCVDLMLHQIIFSSTFEAMPLSWAKNAHKKRKRSTFRPMASHPDSGIDSKESPPSWAVKNTEAILRVGSLRLMASHSESHVDPQESPPSSVYDDTQAALSEQKRQFLEATEPVRKEMEKATDEFDDYSGLTSGEKKTNRKVKLIGWQAQMTPYGGDIVDKGIRVNTHLTEQESAIEQEKHNKLLRPLLIKATEQDIRIKDQKELRKQQAHDAAEKRLDSTEKRLDSAEKRLADEHQWKKDEQERLQDLHNLKMALHNEPKKP